MRYNISFDICGILILLALCLILQKIYVMNSKSNRLFRRFVWVALASGILDVVTAFTIEYSQNVPIPLNVILNTLYMAAATFSTFCGVQYIFSTVKLNQKPHSIFNCTAIAVYFLLLFVNFFTGIIFDFDNHDYNKGLLFYSTYAISMLFLGHVIIVMTFRHRLFTKKQFLFFSSFIFSPLIFVSLQMIFPSYLLTFFATAISSLLMLFGLETPDFVELEYLKKHLENEVLSRTEDLEKANAELKKKNRQAKQDMELAAHLQQVLYPRNTNYLGWDIAVKFEPHSGISGDLYDFYVLGGTLRGFGLFDVSGHGISSGLVTVLAKNAIFHEFRTTLPLNLSDAMKRINDSVIRIKGDIENYLTGVICRIDKDDNSKVELSNAGAPYPIFKAGNEKNSVLIMPDSSKPQYGMIGVEGLDVCFQTINLTMNIGDTIVIYTDGLTEAENSDGDQYGMMRLQSVIDNASGTAEEIMNEISKDFRNFVGEQEIEDDISVIVIKRIEEEELIEELEALDAFEDVETLEEQDEKKT